MKKGVLLLCILAILSTTLYAEPLEYTQDEFPQWAIELRRGETIFFGSLPLTFLASTLMYDASLSFGMDPWTTDDTTKTLYLLGSAAAFSLTIAIIDNIMGNGE